MQVLIESCHSVKIDLGERPPIYTVVSELDDPTWPSIGAWRLYIRLPWIAE